MIYYIKINLSKWYCNWDLQNFFEFLQRDIYWTLDMLELGWRARSYA